MFVGKQLHQQLSWEVGEGGVNKMETRHYLVQCVFAARQNRVTDISLMIRGTV